MNIPHKCPACGCDFDSHNCYLFVRTELGFDGFDDKGRIEDQIYECSNCHVLFRARWKLISFKELIEKD